jgi:UDP-glucose 4-epimerase
MRVLVTGSTGQVGKATVAALSAAGHEVQGTDRQSPGRVDPVEAEYVQADLAIAGDAFSVIHDFDAVVHTAALPRPSLAPGHVVFQNNVMATYNVVEATVRAAIPYVVNISSASVLGHSTAKRHFLPEYLPVDEAHPLRPQETYSLSKLFGETIVGAATERSDLRAISLRPPWVLSSEMYADTLRSLAKDAHELKGVYWSYIDLRDLADAAVRALSALADGDRLAAHEVLFVAAADNAIGRPLALLAAECFGDAVPVRPQEREDCSGVSSTRAGLLLGYAAKHSWRDVLDLSESPQV